MFTSISSEHYTPKSVLRAVVECLGEIELDPCSNSKEHPNVPAQHHFTTEDNGLAQVWKARTLYLNPPYGKMIGRWVGKLVSHHRAGDVAEAIALVPARTDTKWFSCLRDYPVCFVAGRLRFMGSKNSAPFPSAIFYLGNSPKKFHDSFHHLGDIWHRIELGRYLAQN